MRLRRAIALAGVAAATATVFAGTSSPASAASWNCSVHYIMTSSGYEQAAWVHCDGNGPVRVAAHCDTDRYPYRTTLYGDWGSNESIVTSPSSCFLSDAWVEVA